MYNIDNAHNFDYLCGVEVTSSGHRPDDCIELNVPARTYAVFEHAGHISTIEATFRAIWAGGLADAGARAAEGPCSSATMRGSTRAPGLAASRSSCLS